MLQGAQCFGGFALMRRSDNAHSKVSVMLYAGTYDVAQNQWLATQSKMLEGVQHSKKKEGSNQRETLFLWDFPE